MILMQVSYLILFNDFCIMIHSTIIPAKEDSQFISKRISNVLTNLIQITEDKLKLEVIEYTTNSAKTRNWLAPLSIFLISLLAVITTEFKEAFGVQPSIFEALFYLIIVISLILTIVALWNTFRLRKKCTPDHLIVRIKAEQSSIS